jgi:MoaA/NifB/PqqE/SkfB family radical SAM enzyme
MHMTSPLRRAGSEREPWLGSLDFLWLELTPRCNLQCSHCYADAGPTQSLPVLQTLSYENWVDVLRQACDLGCRSVQFTGGEPSLCTDLPALLREARTIGFQSVEVFTNGTHLSRRLRHALVKEGVDLAFSVYGSRREAHDSITGKPGSFAHTLRSIRWALKAGLGVRAGVIEMPSNAADIPATKALLSGLGVHSICVDGVRGVGRSNSHARLRGRALLGELCGECWRGKLAVHPDGNVSPCIFSRFRRVGHVSQSLASILNSERLHRFRREVRKMSTPTRKTGPTKRPCAPLAEIVCAPLAKKLCAPLKTPCAPLKKPCVPLKTPCAPLKTPCAPLRKPCVPLKRACAPLKKEIHALLLKKPCAPLRAEKRK